MVVACLVEEAFLVVASLDSSEVGAHQDLQDEDHSLDQMVGDHMAPSLVVSYLEVVDLASL